MSNAQTTRQRQRSSLLATLLIFYWEIGGNSGEMPSNRKFARSPSSSIVLLAAAPANQMFTRNKRNSGGCGIKKG